VTQARHEVHPPSAAYASALGGQRTLPRRVELSDPLGGVTLIGRTGPIVAAFSRLAVQQRGPAVTPEAETAEPGDPVYPPDCDNGAAGPGVTTEELAILTLMANGLTLDSVAVRVSMSPRTLSRRLRCVCDRLGVAHPIQAIVWAARHGLI
jgi:DNA-binding NarL/FixJ family response regulator